MEESWPLYLYHRVPTLPSKSALAEEYVVKLDKTDDASLGITVCPEDDGSLRIEGVVGGLAGAWNDAHQHRQLRKGDRIIEVNGVHGKAGALLAEVQKQQLLRMKLSRRPRKMHHQTSASEPDSEAGGRTQQYLSDQDSESSAAPSQVPQEFDAPHAEGRSDLTLLGRFTPDCGAKPPMPKSTQAPGITACAREFVVSLDRTGRPDTGLGALVTDQADGSLRVDAIIGGLLKEWNEGHPDLHIKKGDRFVAVNGAQACELPLGGGLLAECQKAEVLKVTVRRELRSRPSLGGGKHRPGELVSSVGRSGQSDISSSSCISSSHSSAGEAEALPAQSLQRSRRSRANGLGQRVHQAVVGETAVTQESLTALSPRTRAVWSRKLTEIIEEDGGKTPRDSSGPGEEVAGGGDGGRTTNFEVCPVREEVAFAEVEQAPSSGPPPPPISKSVVSLLNRGRSGASLGFLARSTRLPSFWLQLSLLLHRSSIQWWRANFQRGIFLGVVSGSAVVLALLDEFVQKEAEWEVLPILNLHCTLALLTSVFCLGVFSTDRPVFWRERSSGISVLAFYISKTVVNMLDLLLQGFLLAALYYVIRQPRLPFGFFFEPFIFVSFASSGIGYVISTVAPPRHGPFIAAILTFISCGLLGHPVKVESMADGGMLELSLDLLSITRWSVSLHFDHYLETTHQKSWPMPDEQAQLEKMEVIYRQTQRSGEFLGARSEVLFLLGMGLFWHIAGYVSLRLSGRRPWSL